MTLFLQRLYLFLNTKTRSAESRAPNKPSERIESCPFNLCSIYAVNPGLQL